MEQQNVPKIQAFCINLPVILMNFDNIICIIIHNDFGQLNLQNIAWQKSMWLIRQISARQIYQIYGDF